MATVNNNRALINQKHWQMMTDAPLATALGSLIASDPTGINNYALYFNNATVHYLYNHNEDGFTQIPSGAFPNAGISNCSCFHPWSKAYTANGGTTTTATISVASNNISGLALGSTIEFLTTSNTNYGLRRTITNYFNNGTTITLTFAAVNTSVVNGNTFRLNTGKYYVMCAYSTLAAGVWRVFDIATMAWQTNLGTTNLPAVSGAFTAGGGFTRESRLALAYQFGVAFATGTATAGGATTITNGAKTWTTNQWTNYQIRITAGTGIGQVKTIVSNTGTVITVSAWTTQPDATSVYSIEGNEDFIYLTGNNVVTLWRYSISGDTWTTPSPGVARGGIPANGLTCDWVGVTGNSIWANESAIIDGQYLYCLRGGSLATIDRYSISANTWSTITHPGTETFDAGSGSQIMGPLIYLKQTISHRFFKYNVVTNTLDALTTNLYPDNSGTPHGSKIWIKNYDSAGVVKWLYNLRNTGTTVHRIMLF